MSFIIKGVDTPKDCMGCPCRKDIELDYRGNLSESYCPVIDGCPDIPETVNYQLDDCPLAALPKIHGRLIDADFLLGRLKEFAKGVTRTLFM